MDRWLHLASPHSRPDSMRVNEKKNKMVYIMGFPRFFFYGYLWLVYPPVVNFRGWKIHQRVSPGKNLGPFQEPKLSSNVSNAV